MIMAAGSGSRIKSDLPKQYTKLDGVPVINYSYQAFKANAAVDKIHFVIAASDEEFFKSCFASDDLPSYSFGGAQRSISVSLGLKYLAQFKPKGVLIHDAARPFVSQAIINNVIEALASYKAVDVGIAVNDTIKQKLGDDISALNRQHLYATQTPQGFDFDFIIQAHNNNNNQQITDDITLAVNSGQRIKLVEGESMNFKITTELDLKLANFLKGKQ
jgi:2-C-methyl-D-erythritol 4-phosphate cytidylyltransferase